VSYIIMAELISWIYDINRFPTPEKFCKYCGIAPVACSSGKTNKLINSKGGVKSLRTTFRTIAIVRVRRSPEDEQYFKRQLSKGKTKKQSLKLVMRKNALVLYALLSKNQAYISPVLS
jgi:transposase